MRVSCLESFYCFHWCFAETQLYMGVADQQQQQYRMNYYPGGLAPTGYVAATDKPGLYAASPYATMPTAYAAAQPGIPAGMQRYASTQHYAMVSQPSPYTSPQAAAAYYASAGAYPTMPLSSLQTISSSSAQGAYLSGQYPTAVSFQAGQLCPTSVAAAGYGGSPLYAASTYTGLPAMPGQPSRAYGVAPMGYTTTNIPSASSPTYPGVTSFGPPYWAGLYMSFALLAHPLLSPKLPTPPPKKKIVVTKFWGWLVVCVWLAHYCQDV